MTIRRLAIAVGVAVSLLGLPASSHAYLVGVADEQAAMFANPYYTKLIARESAGRRISRYIAPYDLADGRRRNVAFLNEFINWYRHAQADHVQMLVAFYHSELSPTRLPSVQTYRRDVGRFIRRYPAVRAWQPWNEANRGDIRHVLASPSPSASARYYQALRAVCHRCTIVGLDILDQNNVRPTLTYLARFKADLRRLHVAAPRLWGLHNYSDTNRFSSKRTKAVLRAVPGQVWLTETGGIVKFGRAFPNRRGSGNRRAVNALKEMFRIAGSYRRITRLYIFQWSGATSRARFDAGLLDPHGVPRPGYVVVCEHMHGQPCAGSRIDSRN